jgi:hypothetical protein
MVIQKRFSLTSASCLCLALTAGNLLYAPMASADNKQEINTLKSLSPFISAWQSAISKKNIPAAKVAEEKYEAKWQGLEVYINHRSLPLYIDMEVDTQFAIRDELEKAKPDFSLLKKLNVHLKEDLNASIQMAQSGPVLSPLFKDLVSLRELRGKSLNIARKALSSTSPDINKAKDGLLIFKNGFPSVASLIDTRSTTAGDEIEAALTAATAVFSDPNATVEQMTTANSKLVTRYGFGVNLVNAAARTANLKKLAITDSDKQNLTQLNVINLALVKDLPAAGETGANSNFAVLQPALESLGRRINIVGTLRTALAAYDKSVKASPSNAADIASAKKTALEAVAITQQALVGQFWGSLALQTFLNSLPKN